MIYRVVVSDTHTLRGLLMELLGSEDLDRKKLTPIRYAIDGIIPEGYTVLSAPQKAGKSWMAQQMCLAVAQGTEFLGHKTTKGTAIYIALEDCEKFAQERQNIVGTHGVDGFKYVFEAPPMDMGFIDELDELTKDIDDLRLVVVDVLGKIEYQPKPRESAVHCEYRTGADLKAWADRRGVSLVAITHNRKEIHNDPFNNISGTVAVTASADALVMISRKNRYDSNAVMAITGRRVRVSLINIRLNESCVWEVIEGNEYKDSLIRKAVEKIADDNIKDALCAKQIKDIAIIKGIAVTESSKAIGAFLTKYKGKFWEDGIDIRIVERGTGSNTYHIRRV